MTWNLTFFGPTDPTPSFSAHNVLVIESGEAFRTGPSPGPPYATPDYSGILSNESAIEGARGNRTLISGSDADFHALRGDSGLCPGLHCGSYDGALGYLINSVNWAAGGTDLGILSFVDGDFPGSFWWNDPNSFLHGELNGYVSGFTENAAIIDAVEATYPMNQGLTSAGLSNWINSFHAGFLNSIPGYTATVNSGSRPGYALSIATAASVPEPATILLMATGLLLVFLRVQGAKQGGDV
ncbi:MAG: PEP-CTERM sorting domain-containing protein [Betaproteobacteria bacterium]